MRVWVWEWHVAVWWFGGSNGGMLKSQFTTLGVYHTKGQGRGPRTAGNRRIMQKKLSRKSELGLRLFLLALDERFLSCK